MLPGTADILRTVKSLELVLYLAWSDVRARYKRSVLGPFWITLSTAIGVVGLGFIWSELFKLERKSYIPLLTMGLILWQFISSTIADSTAIFIKQRGLIKNLDLPLSLHPTQLLLKQTINFLHNLPLYFLVVFFLDSGTVNMNCLWAIPAFLLVFLNLFWIALLIGLLGARFRDLEYFIASILPLLMFFSPVLYKPNTLAFSKNLIWLNPLAYLIEVVRYPFLGDPPPLHAAAGAIALLFLGGGVTLWLFNKKRDRIALWV